MTGAEHGAKAAELLAEAEKRLWGQFPDYPGISQLAQLAQAHATLAVAGSQSDAADAAHRSASAAEAFVSSCLTIGGYPPRIQTVAG